MWQLILGFIEKILIRLLSVCRISFGESKGPIINSKGPIKHVCLNNKPCQTRPTIVNISFDKTLFYPFTVSVNKCGGSCKTIDDSHVWFCAPNKAKRHKRESI